MTSYDFGCAIVPYKHSLRTEAEFSERSGREFIRGGRTIIRGSVVTVNMPTYSMCDTK